MIREASAPFSRINTKLDQNLPSGILCVFAGKTPGLLENIKLLRPTKRRASSILGSDHFLRAHQLVELLFREESQCHGGLFEGGALLVRLLGNLLDVSIRFGKGERGGQADRDTVLLSFLRGTTAVARHHKARMFSNYHTRPPPGRRQKLCARGGQHKSRFFTSKT